MVSGLRVYRVEGYRRISAFPDVGLKMCSMYPLNARLDHLGIGLSLFQGFRRRPSCIVCSSLGFRIYRHAIGF